MKAVNGRGATMVGLLVVACFGIRSGRPVTAQELGSVGDARVMWNASRGLSSLEVVCNDKRFRPFARAAALDKQGHPDPKIPVNVQAAIDGNVLRLTVTASHTAAGGFDPGLVRGFGPWRRLDLSRYAEPYGQTWWPKVNYCVEGDFWFTAHWVMEQSDATRWNAPQQSNQGHSPFPGALQVVYEPDTAGAYLPLHELLELRFSRHLWEVVPKPRQQPSAYRDFLARSVFVDLWGGQSAAQLMHFLRVLRAIGQDRQSFYIVLQNWEVGGWDALLPDSMWLPDYPPNPAVGTPQQLSQLCALGKSMGRFGFRTNYRILRESSPSYQRHKAHYSVDADGKRLDYLRCADWLSVAGRADREIRDTFHPNAGFTDQMTSGAAPWQWHDWAADGGSRSVRQTLAHQQQLARSMKSLFAGPLGSETLSDQHLLGEFVDTGDYGIYNGHQRLISPEFKLKRLQHLSGFHGMGLMYRFYEMPPFPRFHSATTTFRNDDVQLDDYRACEILYGNGGYVCHDFANWRYTLPSACWWATCSSIIPLKKSVKFATGMTALDDARRTGATRNCTQHRAVESADRRVWENSYRLREWPAHCRESVERESGGHAVWRAGRGAAAQRVGGLARQTTTAGVFCLLARHDTPRGLSAGHGRASPVCRPAERRSWERQRSRSGWMKRSSCRQILCTTSLRSVGKPCRLIWRMTFPSAK